MTTDRVKLDETFDRKLTSLISTGCLVLWELKQNPQRTVPGVCDYMMTTDKTELEIRLRDAEIARLKDNAHAASVRRMREIADDLDEMLGHFSGAAHEGIRIALTAVLAAAKRLAAAEVKR